MEIIQKKIGVELTIKEAGILEMLFAAAWKAGGIRSPEDGEAMEKLRARIKALALGTAKEKKP
jgi:hypothetical protein